MAEDEHKGMRPRLDNYYNMRNTSGQANRSSALWSPSCNTKLSERGQDEARPPRARQKGGAPEAIQCIRPPSCNL